jgi:NAD(P)H-dependent FMN reductase
MGVPIICCSLRLSLLILIGSTSLFSQNRQPVRDAGAVAGTFNIGSVSFNVNIPNSDFDLAGGGQ